MKRSMIWTDHRRRVAYHEAAHGVVALLEGIRFAAIEICPPPTEGTAGRVWEPKLKDSKVNKIVPFAMAGSIQDRMNGYPEHLNLANSHRDFELIEKLNPHSKSFIGDRESEALKEWPNPWDWEQFLSEMHLRTQSLIHENQTSIRIVAQALREKQTLTYDEVKELVSS